MLDPVPVKAAGAPTPWPHPTPPPQLPDSVDIVAVLSTVLQRWPFLLAGLVAGLIVSTAVWMTTPPIYRATTTLMITQTGAGAAAGGTFVNAFRLVLLSHPVAAKALGDLKGELTRFRVDPNIIVDSTTIEADRSGTVLTLQVLMGKPEAATVVADGLVRHGAEFSSELRRQDAEQFKTMVGEIRTQAEQNVAAAQQRLLAFKQSAQIDLLKTDTDAMLQERGKLLKLTVDIEAARARLQAARKEASARPPTIKLRRTIDSDPMLMELSKETRTSPDSPAWQLENEIINPAFQVADTAAAEAETLLASLERQRSELVQRSGIGQGELVRLKELYTKQIELSRLQAEFDLAQKIFQDTSARFEEARFRATAERPILQQLTPAFADSRAVAPRPLRLLAVGGVAGLSVGIVAALLHRLFGRKRTPTHA